MAHFLLEQYPKMDGSFLFLNVHIIPKNLIPLLPRTERTVDDAYCWELYNRLKKGYLSAEDEDFLFVRDGKPCEESEAEELYFRTSLTDAAGGPIDLHAVRNERPMTRWFTKSFQSGGKGISLKEAVLGVAREDRPRPVPAEELPLTERYPKFSNLVFLHNEKISERLPLLLGESLISPLRIQADLELQYRTKGLEACCFVRKDQPASPEEADTLYFTTGFKTPDGRDVVLQCERNQNNHAEPWFGKFFNAGREENSALRPFYEKVFVPDALLGNSLWRMMKKVDHMATPATMRADLAKRYAEAQQGEIRLFTGGFFSTPNEDEADQMILPTGYFHGETGEEIMLRCKRNRRVDDSHSWIARRYYAPSENPFFGRRPGKWLLSWAKFGRIGNDLGDVLSALESLALKEVWSFNQDKRPILRNYFLYTFVRLWREGKVIENEEAGYAAFNTGLVNRAYEYIYAMFYPNPSAGDSRRWMFAGFCVANEDRLGKELVRNFYPRPQPARYFRNGENIYYKFDDALPIEAQLPTYDAEHILLERTYRMPLSFFKKYQDDLPGLKERLGEIRRIPSANAEEIKAQWKQIGELLRGSDSTYRNMKDAVDKAVKIAVKRASWNYRTVIPYYSPMDDKISLLLPISLSGEDAPDAAMVLEPIERGHQTYYMGHTIITLYMAYCNSRLVCRPESDWLNVNAICNSGEVQEEVEMEEET